MATIVFFHAHPDDEAIATGGTMAKMASEGHRVVLVTATRGELGEVPEGALVEGESLGEHRERELALASEALGVSRLEFLGYRDSGMLGESTNEDSVSFWQADLEEASRRLASILEEESAVVLTTYDEHGGYGHPDHVQVHRVGVRAAEIAKTPLVFLADPEPRHDQRAHEPRRQNSVWMLLTASTSISRPSASPPSGSRPESTCPASWNRSARR